MTEENQEVLELDVNEMTIGDMEYLDETIGDDWLEQFAAGKLRGKQIVHVVYRLLLGKDSNATLDDARKVKIKALGTAAEDKAAESPTNAGSDSESNAVGV